MEQRKKIRLNGYDYSQPGRYFVTICTKEKRHLLGAVVGADVLIGPQMKLSALGQVVDRALLAMAVIFTMVNIILNFFLRGI